MIGNKKIEGSYANPILFHLGDFKGGKRGLWDLSLINPPSPPKILDKPLFEPVSDVKGHIRNADQAVRYPVAGERTAAVD